MTTANPFLPYTTTTLTVQFVLSKLSFHAYLLELFVVEKLPINALNFFKKI